MSLHMPNFGHYTPLPTIEKQNEILDILKRVLYNQELLDKRLSAIESTISDNGKALKDDLNKIQNNQSKLSLNQKYLSQTLGIIEINVASCTQKTHSKLWPAHAVFMKNRCQPVCYTSGEADDKTMHVITLPFRSFADIRAAEDRLKIPGHVQELTSMFYKLRGVCADVSYVMQHVFSDEVLELYNWEGRFDKQPLCKLWLVNSIMRDVFKDQSADDFEKNVKRSLELSHHRFKQKLYLEKKKNEKIILI
ncbi:uncharacterized protein LOC128855916 [Anastrepha ludens]|uniref:uncharacterized protein LOC128855916 n=1 Tax=Anastrepha ludens TaxID=28586 RepID=UPI0023AEC9D8|nr:uncharacterized protein LOC128855916 [Anastrepha ludens]XP_053947133.1 uncharacterized protein LOC128855916 [Anastrepha ludens]XP_053947134.1 uncharacterized protein LOC128855916 [Anastrepha ludens]